MPCAPVNCFGWWRARPAAVLRHACDRLKSFKRPERSGARGCSAVGSAQPCQGWGREFESRHPLECRDLPSGRSRHVGSNHTRWRGRAARHRPAKPFTRVRIPSPPQRHCHLHSNSIALTGAIGAAVARFPDTEEVTGSIPVSRTTRIPDQARFSGPDRLSVPAMRSSSRRVARFARCCHGPAFGSATGTAAQPMRPRSAGRGSASAAPRRRTSSAPAPSRSVRCCRSPESPSCTSGRWSHQGGLGSRIEQRCHGGRRS